MTRVEMWTYRDTTLSQRNLSGLKVEALDGSIGRLTTRERRRRQLHRCRYRSLDLRQEGDAPGRSGQQGRSRHRDGLRQSDEDEIKNAPEYDEDKEKSDNKYRERYRSDLGGYYGPGGLGYRDDELI